MIEKKSALPPKLCAREVLRLLGQPWSDSDQDVVKEPVSVTYVVTHMLEYTKCFMEGCWIRVRNGMNSWTRIIVK